METVEQKQMDALSAIRGQQGTHYDLALAVEALGFEVRMDAENNERSEIVLTGCWNPDGSNIIVGEILGDSEAVIR